MNMREDPYANETEVLSGRVRLLEEENARLGKLLERARRRAPLSESAAMFWKIVGTACASAVLIGAGIAGASHGPLGWAAVISLGAGVAVGAGSWALWKSIQ